MVRNVCHAPELNRVRCANISRFPNTAFAAKQFQSLARLDKGQTSIMRSQWKHKMFAVRIKNPQCPKCGTLTSLRIIKPERPGFDSRTFECPKCYDTETFLASISRE